jgi:thioredoxin-like negative regulator of GroEL
VTWRDDFSLARNFSLEMATHAWVLVIDADERLDPLTGPNLRRAIRDPEKQAFLVALDDVVADKPASRTSLPRLFRNRPEIRFSRPVHENIMESLFAIGASALEESGVRLVHLGYQPEIMRARDKQARNLAILKRRFAEAPQDYYNAYKLAVTLPASEISEKLRVFEAAYDFIDTLSDRDRLERPFVARFYDAYASTLTHAGQLSRALTLVKRARELYPEVADLIYRHGEIMRRFGHFADAEELIELALMPRQMSTVRADRPYELITRCWVSRIAVALDGGSSWLPPRPTEISDLELDCAALRLELQRGRIQHVAVALAPLLQSDFQRDVVKLLAGELAWTLRDFSTAQSMWEMTNESSDSGHRARTWLALVRVVRDQLTSVDISVCDSADAALVQVIAELSGRSRSLDPAFCPEALALWKRRWRDHLRHASRPDLADRLEVQLRVKDT